MAARWCSWGLALGLMLTSAAAYAASATLESVRLDSQASGVSVHFHFDSVPKYHWFALANPARAVIDFDHTRAGNINSVSGGAVHRLRLARHADGTLRAVLDLGGKAQLDNVHVRGDDVIASIHGGGSAAPGASSSSSSHQDGSASSTSKPDRGHAASRRPNAVYRAEASNDSIVVVIDPGHGGHDPGTRARNGLMEKTVNLAIAKRLYERLKQTQRMHPILTRHNDTFVTLRQRVHIAQEHHANLFVSIHANAYPNDRSVKGGTCYMLSEHGATDAKTAQLAHFENTRDRSLAGVHFSGDPTLNAVLTDLFQNASIEDADDVAQNIIHQFAQIEPIYRHKPPRANFAVLRDPMVPSVLCETAFLSNPHQAKLMGTRRFRNELADAMYKGIVKYFHNHPPEKMRATGGSMYTVKPGDTLSGIASRQGVSENAIMDINHLHSKTLQAGQKLQLPNHP
ncbi:N-acetylmuramoyl-L-alanine amidase [Salinisphaera sp. RV14]|uniref:N-acetylmuramoyl-L-alanine amidase n=1 Tax=Salinisphaera sp. RV14 TaxID=3454140 RepID=UPI003F86EAEC